MVETLTASLLVPEHLGVRCQGQAIDVHSQQRYVCWQGCLLYSPGLTRALGQDMQYLVGKLWVVIPKIVSTASSCKYSFAIGADPAWGEHDARVTRCDMQALSGIVSRFLRSYAPSTLGTRCRSQKRFFRTSWRLQYGVMRGTSVTQTTIAKPRPQVTQPVCATVDRTNTCWSTLILCCECRRAVLHGLAFVQPRSDCPH